MRVPELFTGAALSLVIGATAFAAPAQGSHTNDPEAAFREELWSEAATSRLRADGMDEMYNTGVLHARLQAETRDDVWAPAHEQAIETVLEGWTSPDAERRHLRVTCARTICEVAAVWTSNDAEALNAVLQDFHAAEVPLRETFRSEGSVGVFSPEAKPEQMHLIAYYFRRS